MNFTSQDYHTDRYREIYLSSAGWNRSAYTTDAFRYAFENFVNVAADFSDFTDESIAIMHNPDGSVTYTNIDWNKIHWFDNITFSTPFSIEKEIKAADSDKIDEFLS